MGKVGSGDQISTRFVKLTGKKYIYPSDFINFINLNWLSDLPGNIIA